MHFVYLIRSIKHPGHHYVGYSVNVTDRLDGHNKGKSVHTNKFKPWKLAVYFAFVDEQQAKRFERYLKTGSGRAFLKKHFL